VFAGQKHRMGLVVRTIGIARATIKIGMANLVYNFQRLAWLEASCASTQNHHLQSVPTRKSADQPETAAHHPLARLHLAIMPKSDGSSRSR
jgi:hypothetical protein